MNARTPRLAAFALSLLMTLSIFSGVVNLMSANHGDALYAQAASAPRG